MSDCCTISPGSKDKTHCPKCGQKGLPVELITLKSLLVPKAMQNLDATESYSFCRTADCPVVYFSACRVFEKDELTVSVFQKETADPLPVCYCFGFSRQDILDEIYKTGKSTLQQQISDYVRQQQCACELRNPQGRCCLGNVAAVLKQGSLAVEVS